MNSTLLPIDYLLFLFYVVLIIAFGLWVSRTRKGVERTSRDYFLAGNRLSWWAIGASLIASNISAEQFIGMSGSGYAIGLGIAAYEWLAAIALILVGKYFLPIYLEKRIYTMPQFLTIRFDRRVSTSLAIFFVLLYVFVNLTSVSYLGALAIIGMFGLSPEYLVYIIMLLFVFAILYSLWGGLSAVAWTDIIQVIFLVGGGLVTTFIGLQAVASRFGETGWSNGLRLLYERAPEKFDLILSPDNPQYANLPGVTVLIGFMLLTHIGYWGLNQYIIQRGLAAKSVNEARKGVLFAGYLKLLLPAIVVLPGIIAYVMGASIAKPDEAYPWLLRSYVPAGVKGLALAALVAAIVSSLCSMINSTATIFSLDIYKTYIKKDATERHLVTVGRVSGLCAVLLAILVAPQLRTFDQAFQFIQEFTGFVYPGIIVIYFMGLFWKQATAKAALWVAIVCLPVSLALKFFYPEMAFMDRMGYVFILLAFVGVAVTLATPKGAIAVTAPATPGRDRRGWLGPVLMVLGVALALLSYAYLHLHALYVTAAFALFMGVMFIGNSQGRFSDPGSITLRREWFVTKPAFNIAASGICCLLFVVYYFLY